MTPQLTTEQLAAQSGTTECASLGETHLTSEQFGELMGGTTETASAELAQAEAHLLVCEQCAAEFASLRDAISLFREASNAYADEELRSRPRWILPARRSHSQSLIPAYWVAAAAMFLTALLPLQVMRRHTLAPPAAGVSSVAASVAVSNAASDTQSDEALLEDVNSEISASVPTSMQALADPTADASTVNNESSVPTTNQRKD
jgi:anti-sigma factor RsiW